MSEDEQFSDREQLEDGEEEEQEIFDDGLVILSKICKNIVHRPHTSSATLCRQC